MMTSINLSDTELSQSSLMKKSSRGKVSSSQNQNTINNFKINIALMSSSPNKSDNSSASDQEELGQQVIDGQQE